MSGNAAEHLVEEIHTIIDRFRYEYELTYAELVGCLEMIKWDMMNESSEEEEDQSR